MQRIHNNTFIIALYFFIVTSSLCIYLFSKSQGYYFLNNIEYSFLLSGVSLAYFGILLIFSLLRKDFFWFILPLVILTVPNAINDFFPSFYLGPLDDRGAATGSIFTHIDIYLLFGYLNFVRKNNSPTSTLPNRVLLIFIIFTSCNFVVAIFYNFYFRDILPIHILGYCFQLRYVLLVYLINQYANDSQALKSFLNGLSIGIIMVLIEALLYTALSGGPFTSGNFGTNTLSILLISSCFLFFNNWSKKKNLFYVLVGLIALISAYFTDTRMAFIGLFLVFLIMIHLKVIRAFAHRRILIKVYEITLAIIFGAIILYLTKLFNNELYIIYDAYQYILSSGYESILNSGLINPDNSSLFTRFSLWIVSIYMIFDHPFGVGTGFWNYLKSDYGLPMQIFIDPHNDYIYAIAQYGWFAGPLFIFTIFLFPLFYLYKLTKEQNIFFGLFYFAIYICIVGITNTNLNKHQFFALVLVALFTIPSILIQNKRIKK